MPDKIDTQKIAKLARLKLTEIESDKLGEYLEQVIDYIDQLNQLDTSNVQPTSHVLPVNNVFRDDEASKSKNIDYLTEAPSNNKGHYEVPKII
ncbi:MAG TPA: Asp-tRNA(Asn)/Glu-tRNA(Gln) amidotransferase subunit GatC [Nitrospinaceae bacterium]|jgi:aspartyl-tRNA(Asn)/glutamyl-tRNA(Gln) amidotransferase subunit C|nr:Asp-tRNA(Asn)/Glu-tRNA(Gln) amidotransferase subunit GatC [Nitrospinaceae bacterium]